MRATVSPPRPALRPAQLRVPRPPQPSRSRAPWWCCRPPRRSRPSQRSAQQQPASLGHLQVSPLPQPPSRVEQIGSGRRPTVAKATHRSGDGDAIAKRVAHTTSRASTASGPPTRVLPRRWAYWHGGANVIGARRRPCPAAARPCQETPQLLASAGENSRLGPLWWRRMFSFSVQQTWRCALAAGAATLRRNRIAARRTPCELVPSRVELG